MKQSRNKIEHQQVPYKLSVLLKSPGGKKELLKYGTYHHKLHTSIQLESISAVYVLIVFILFATRALFYLGIFGIIISLLAGIVTILVVLNPVKIVLVYRQWNLWKQKIHQSLHDRHLDTYYPMLVHKGDRMNLNQRINKRRHHLEKRYLSRY